MNIVRNWCYIKLVQGKRNEKDFLQYITRFQRFRFLDKEVGEREESARALEIPESTMNERGGKANQKMRTKSSEMHAIPWILPSPLSSLSLSLSLLYSPTLSPKHHRLLLFKSVIHDFDDETCEPISLSCFTKIKAWSQKHIRASELKKEYHSDFEPH